MNDTNDFISTLTSNRAELVNKLASMGSYSRLHKIFTEINTEADDTIKIGTPSHLVYCLLTGKHNGSKYVFSAISWLPSTELVDALSALALDCGIIHIEEIQTDHGILAALLALKLPQTRITAATNPLTIKSTSCRLPFTKVAKRSIEEYAYHDRLGVPRPDMVICSAIPDVMLGSNTSIPQPHLYPQDLTKNIVEMIECKQHKVIVLITSCMCENIWPLLSHMANTHAYMVETIHIKAFDKFFAVSNLLAPISPSGLLAHVLVRADVCMTKSITTIMEPATLPVNRIDPACTLMQYVLCLSKVLPKLVMADLIDKYVLDKPYADRKELLIITKVIHDLKLHSSILPHFLQTAAELESWLGEYKRGLCLSFQSRMQYEDYMSRIEVLASKSSYEGCGLPRWIHSGGEAKAFTYLSVIEYGKGRWQRNRDGLNDTLISVSKANREALLASKSPHCCEITDWSDPCKM